MYKYFWRIVWSVVCPVIFGPPAFGQIPDLNAPHILAVTHLSASSTNVVCKLVSISSNGSKEIADLRGQVLDGKDKEIVAFLETPANKSRSERSLLIIDRKTS